MVKIINPNIPNTKGKLILQYKGTNTILRNSPDSSDVREVILRYKESTFGNTTETFPLFFNLLDGTEIMLAFSSRSIYRKGKSGNEEFWISDNESKIIENEIVIDTENIFITGSFTFLKAISLSEARLEKFHYTAIFKRTESLVKEFLFLREKGNIPNDFKQIQTIAE